MGGGNNAIIKTINGKEVQNIDIGYFRTSRNAYVILPTFESNSIEGLSFYIDAKINQRSTNAYDRAITLGYSTHYQTHLALNCGNTEYGRIRYFHSLPTQNFLDPGPIFKVGVSSASSVGYGFAKNYISNIIAAWLPHEQFNGIFNNNFLCAETPTMLNKVDISYGLVLIYNRSLTEEEMLHNYEYSLTIKRV